MRGSTSLTQIGLLVVLLCAATTSLAGWTAAPTKEVIDPGSVPADATWVLHINTEGIANSELMTAIVGGEAGARNAIDGIRDQLKADMGFDPLDHMSHITIHGRNLHLGMTDDSANVGAGEIGMVAVTTPIIDDIIETAISDMPEGEYQLLDQNGMKIHRFGEEGSYESVYATIMPGRTDDERILVASATTDRLTIMHDVLIGKAKSVRDIDDGLVVKARTGSLFYFTGASLKEMVSIDNDPIGGSRVIKLVNDAAFEVSEQGRMVRVDIALETDSEESVNKVRGVIQGMVSLGQLISAEVPELEFVQPLAESIRFNSDDTRLTIGLSMNVNDVRGIMQMLLKDMMEEEMQQNDADADGSDGATQD